MGTVDDLILLTEVLEAGSLSAASRKTGIPKSTLSRRMDDLEKELGVHLLRRGPRDFSATEIGAAILERGQKIRDELRAIKALAEVRTRHPTGTLRISCPVILADILVADFAIAFARDNPDVRVTLDSWGGSFEPKIEHYALAIQPQRDTFASPELARQKLSTAASRLVATPDLVHSFGKVSVPADLNNRPAIGWSADGFTSRWKLINKAGKATELKVDLKFNGNHLDIIRRAALSGLGLARLPLLMCEDDLRDGRLVLPLAGWSPPSVTIYALYQSRRSLTLAGKLFISGLLKHLRDNIRDGNDKDGL